jgi:hypothetical protein
MDLRAYYQKIRDVERELLDEFPVVVSNQTPDGGKCGLKTEVTRRIAAKMIAEGRARLATLEETTEFRDENAASKRTADQLTPASRLQVTLMSEGKTKRTNSTSREKK